MLSKIDIGGPSLSPANITDPVDGEYLYLIGSRKTSEADPHWPVISHMPILEPISVASARLNALELPGKGWSFSTKTSLTKGGTG